MGYLEVYYLICKYWRFSWYLFVFYFYFYSIIGGEHTLYDLNCFTLVVVCFMVQDILVNVSWALEKICILLLLGRVFYKCKLDPHG